jgi:hypothetical protein
MGGLAVASEITAPQMTFIRARLLILGGPFYVIDDKPVDWSFGRFEFESELFLHRSEYRGDACRFGSGQRAIVGQKGHSGKLRSLFRKLDINIELSGDSGLVDHGTVEYQEELFGKVVERSALSFRVPSRIGQKPGQHPAIFLARLERGCWECGRIGSATPFSERVQLWSPTGDS